MAHNKFIALGSFKANKIDHHDDDHDRRILRLLVLILRCFPSSSTTL